MFLTLYDVCNQQGNVHHHMNMDMNLNMNINMEEEEEENEGIDEGGEGRTVGKQSMKHTDELFFTSTVSTSLLRCK